MKKIIFVSGASSGMGVEFALQASKESAILKQKNSSIPFADEIWLLARREDKLFKTKSMIESESEKNGLSAFYPKAVCISLDLTGSYGAKKVKELFENEAKSDSFEIVLLINNAGFGTYGEFCNTDVGREMEMIDLNCTSLTGITGFALPYMKKGDRIINTASLASFLPLGNFAVYGACKAYVLSFTIALRAELKQKGIKVTALCPGPVSTEFAAVASKGARLKVKNGLSAQKTVSHCLKKSRKGRLYSLWAFKWKFKAFLSRFVGRYTGAYFTWKFCKRPSF